MGTNIALKRAKKALHRKQLAVQRRKLEIVESAVGGRARRAALSPIQHCYLHGDAGDSGMATVVITRGVSPYQFMAVFFLVDLLCLGIKDVIVHDMTVEQLGTFVDNVVESGGQLDEVDPSYARKLVRDAAAWAATIGFKPPRDYVAVEQIFGDVDTDACDTTFTFGVEGRPCYIVGPGETPAQVRQRLTHLRDRLGPDGFDFVLPTDDD